MFYSQDSLIKSIINDGTISATIKNTETNKPLISLILILISLTLFLSAEWLVKKLWGSI